MGRYRLIEKIKGEFIQSFESIKDAYSFVRKKGKKDIEYELFDSELHKISCYFKR
jgi:hypothetical protein